MRTGRWDVLACVRLEEELTAVFSFQWKGIEKIEHALFEGAQ